MLAAAVRCLLLTLRFGLGGVLFLLALIFAVGAAIALCKTPSWGIRVTFIPLVVFLLAQAWLVWRILLVRPGRPLFSGGLASHGHDAGPPQALPEDADGGDDAPPLMPVPRPPGKRPPVLSARAPLDED